MGDAVRARVAEIVAAEAGRDGPLLPILNRVQAEFGHVPRDVLPDIAAALNISRADIHGVVTFYHDYKDAPQGRTIVRLCRAEACQAMGGRAVAAEVQAALGLGWGETTPDGAVTLEAVYCLGLCACAPAAMIGAEVLGRVDAEAVLAAVSR